MYISTNVAPLFSYPTLSKVIADSMVVSYSILSSSDISCIAVSTGLVLFLLGRRSLLIFDFFLEFKSLFLGFLGLKNLGQEMISSQTNIIRYILEY